MAKTTYANLRQFFSYFTQAKFYNILKITFKLFVVDASLRWYSTTTCTTVNFPMFDFQQTKVGSLTCQVLEQVPLPR